MLNNFLSHWVCVVAKSRESHWSTKKSIEKRDKISITTIYPPTWLCHFDAKFGKIDMCVTPKVHQCFLFTNITYCYSGVFSGIRDSNVSKNILLVSLSDQDINNDLINSATCTSDKGEFKPMCLLYFSIRAGLPLGIKS